MAQRIIVRTRLSRAEARRVIAALPAVASGRAPDTTGEARRMQLAIGAVALSLVKQAFVQKSEGRADEAGLRWEPLAPSTVAKRRKGRGQGAPLILRDTGLLFNSLSPGISARPNPGQVIVGTNDPKAAWHHRGTTTIPARPLWPDPED